MIQTKKDRLSGGWIAYSDNQKSDAYGLVSQGKTKKEAISNLEYDIILLRKWKKSWTKSKDNQNAKTNPDPDAGKA